MKYFIYILISLIFSSGLNAQISPELTGLPPTLHCVKREASNQISIQWSASTNPGSCFSQYGVYISQNDKSGPYQRVQTVTSPADGTLTFNPQLNGVLYVFMINEQSCPNTSVTQIQTSDTLDNIVPQAAPVIVKVSVENNIPAIYWRPSKNPEVSDYAIFSNKNFFNDPIDTVMGRNSSFFPNPDHNPSDSVAVYKIRSIEYCEDPQGLFSNISEPYNTILVSRTEEDICKRSVTLNWNGYNNHTEPVLGYRIDYSENGGSFTAKESLEAGARAYDFTGLTPQVNTCIRVVAILPGNEESWSNVLCVTGKGIAPMESHYIRNITVNSDHVEIEYIPDPAAEISEIALERSSNGQLYTVLSSGVSVQQESPGTPYIIKDFSALTARTALYYQVAVKNACSDKFTTLPAKTILLEGENLGISNEVHWDNLIVDEDDVTEYELYRIFEDDTVLIFDSYSPEEHNDAGIYSNNFFAELCYLIKAKHQTTNEDRPADVFVSQSNTVCLEPTPQAFVPNAFAPYGHNKVFKPVIVFGTDINYSLTVFDRNGTKVFESSQPNLGWNGLNNGKRSALDSYVYHLQFTGLNGLTYKKTGFVVLVQ